MNITVEFPGEELKKSLDNIQGLLDAAKPLAEQLVRDEKVKQTIAKCIEALQALLSENHNQDWSEIAESKGRTQMKDSQQQQARIRELRSKERTPSQEKELAELETQEGMR